MSCMVLLVGVSVCLFVLRFPAFKLLAIALSGFCAIFLIEAICTVPFVITAPGQRQACTVSTLKGCRFTFVCGRNDQQFIIYILNFGFVILMFHKMSLMPESVDFFKFAIFLKFQYVRLQKVVDNRRASTMCYKFRRHL